jgi:hypothetical protein
VIIVLTAGHAVKSPASIRTGHTVTPKLRHGGTHRSKTRHSIATAALSVYVMNSAPAPRSSGSRSSQVAK